MKLFIGLIIIFQLKHFLCDYLLQTRYMLGKFSSDPAIWIPALMAHGYVHAAFTFLISAIVIWHVPGPWSLWTALVFAFTDLWLHIIMDRVKASPKLLGRWKSDSPYFWWALGFDQMFHHFTHYFIAFGLAMGALQ